MSNKNSSIINWFQIPARDLGRAKSFYEATLEVKLAKQDTPGMKTEFFPGTESGIGGSLVESPHHEPSDQGTTVFFDVGDGLDAALGRAEKAGGKVAVPKTSIGEWGFIAQIIDTEGNRVALHGTK